MERVPRLVTGKGGGSAIVERASSGDLMELATDVGPMRMQIGAVLRLESGDGDESLRRPDAHAFAEVIAARAARVRRLRQVFRRAPFGCGRPVWVDDPSVSVPSHVAAIPVDAPGDDEALLRTAVRVVTAPLTYARPLWRAAVVEGLDDGGLAVVIAVHHVMADGAGGLGLLARLVDEGQDLTDDLDAFPRPVPSRGALFADATRGRLAAVRRARVDPGALPRIVRPPGPTGPGSTGGPGPATAVATRTSRTSLMRPVSGELHVTPVRVPLDGLRDAARTSGATVNDALLTAVAGAVRGLLARRGERIDALRVSVPVSLRGPSSISSNDGPRLGNRVGAMVVVVPATGTPGERLRQVASLTREAKEAARTGSGRMMVPLIRTLSAMGLLRVFIEHQRLVQVFVSNVPGPERPARLAGRRVTRIVPVTVVAGNVTTSFLALSYAGELTVSVCADPRAIPEQTELPVLLAAEFEALTGITGAVSGR